MVTYEQWNKAIISYFFEECEPGDIVFLHTTPETLSEIAEQAGLNVGDAEESLKEVVRKKVVSGTRLLLSPISSQFLLKNTSEEEPPQVAFLALSVLAASMMDSEGSVASNDYYIRLNKVLFEKSIKGSPSGFSGKDFEDFWQRLKRWADSRYDAKLYLTVGPPNRKYVRYPISQCPISNHDRRGIYRFFRSHKLTPFSDITEDQLKKDFGIWLDSSDGSKKINRYFSANDSYRKLIVSQVKSLLKNWNYEIPPEPVPGQRQPSSSCQIRVELRFDQFNNVESRYWFRRRGRDEINCETNSLGIKCLQTFNSEKWFRPVPDNSGMFWNSPNALQLQTDEIKPLVYTLHRSNIWVFRVDPECDGGWISQTNMQLYEDHLIVFQKRFIEQVKDHLKQVCEQEIETPKPIYVSEKENGWFYLRATPTTRKSVGDPDLWMLSVNSSKQIQIRGLSVKGQDGHRAYLNICPITVFVPELSLFTEEPLRIGEKTFPVNADRLIKLENTLEVGIHRLCYGNKTRELRVIAPERSLEYQEETLTAELSQDQETIPAYSSKAIDEITGGAGLWLAGAKFFGTDIPATTWDDVQTEPLAHEKDENQSFKSPAQLISSVVRLAIELKDNKTSIPEWFDETIKYLDQNVAVRTLVQKKLKDYHKTALSYADLCKYVGR